jgi:DNA-binding CsgD family transcriptional regulator
VLSLSQPEREICDLLIQSLSNREIAARLSTTEEAVKQYLERIFVRNEIDPTRNRRVLLAVLYHAEIQEASAPSLNG